MKGKGLLFAASMVMFSSMIYDAKAEEYMDAPEVVVSATRTEQYISDVPSAVEVVTAEEIQRMGAQDVQEVLAKSFNMLTEGHNGGFSIRGMGSSQTKILINGRAPVVYGSKNETVRRTLDLIPAENIERIEILRGPASALYGEAMAGVINIITKESSEKSGTLGVTSSTRYADITARFDTGKMGKWSDVLALEFKREWGYEDEDSQWMPRPTDGSYSSLSDATKFYRNEYYVNNSLAYTINDDHKIQLDTNFFQKDNAARSASSDPYPELVLSNTLIYEGATGDHFYNIGASHSITTRGDSSVGNDQDWTVISVDAQDSWIVNDYNTLTFGGKAEFVDANTKVSRRVGSSTVYDARTANTESYGFYLQDEISLFDETLYIVPAIRYDYYNSFGSYIAPKIGLTYEYIPNHRFKANYGMGYSAPNATQLYGQSSGGYGTTLASPDLEPEENTSWEVRLEGDITNNLSYAVGYYHNEITNLIQLGDLAYTVGSTNYYYNENIGKARTQGVEAELSYDFYKYFTATVQYTYNDARNLTDNERLSATPYNTVLASLDFAHEDWGLYGSFWGKYYQNFNDQEWSSANFDFYRVSFSLSKTFAEDYTVTFNALNFIQSNENYENAGYIEPAEYKINFTMKF